MRNIDHETCDACGPHVRASVLIRNIPMVTVDDETGLRSFSFGGELTLCGHHYGAHEIAIVAAGYTVHDYRLIHKGAAV